MKDCPCRWFAWGEGYANKSMGKSRKNTEKIFEGRQDGPRFWMVGSRFLQKKGGGGETQGKSEEGDPSDRGAYRGY